MFRFIYGNTEECTAMAESCDIPKAKALEILGVGGGQSLVL